MAISGTHTHSGPAGFLQYVLYQVTSLGYVKETFDAWVDGIASAIVIAHRNLQPAKTVVNSGKLYESNINRSPSSYLLNPQEERDAYPDGDTDKTMLLLSFKGAARDLGVLNWFAVHGTSMNNTNTLTSGDNRGYASYTLEKAVNGDAITGTGAFVAAFASTNLGDVSPNTMGAKCLDTGESCSGGHSACNGRCENCIAFGPGTNGDMFESTQIIGGKQADFAKQLMDTATEAVSGPIDYRHSFVNMPALNVTTNEGVKQLCMPAMGYSFAAGTTDGPGMFGFTQGTTSGNAFWDKVRDFLSEPTPEQIACQAPKPIFINTGGIEIPYQWDPITVPVQILRMGNVFVLSAPSEFTTMAGRRLRKAISTILEAGNVVRSGEKIYVTIAGLTNTYSSYVTTFEEYQAQRYEAASNIYGPHALEGYIQEFSRLARDMVAGRPSTTDLPPPDLTDQIIQLMPVAHYDRVPKDVKFGDVIVDAKASYAQGEEVSVSFHAANPRHNQRVGGTYLSVEQKTATAWKLVANDGDWSTKFRWLGGKEDPLDMGFSKQSTATLSWKVDHGPGTYRMCYHGDHLMNKSAKVVPFMGCSSEFTVTA